MADVDLFLAAGQSNSLGRGDSGASPAVPTGEGFDVSSGSVSNLSDPVGGATSGSAWPAFGNAMYASTGRPVAICSKGVSGTALLEAAATEEGKSWNPDEGDYFAPAIAALFASFNALALDGHRPVLRGVLWSQGEREAQDTTTAADYTAALIALSWSFRAAFGVRNLPMYVFRTGRPDSGDTAQWAAIRGAQDAAALATEGIVMAFTGAVDFPGESEMSDELHYSQDGYNEMGTDGAAVVAASLVAPDFVDPSGLLVASPFLMTPAGPLSVGLSGL